MLRTLAIAVAFAAIVAAACGGSSPRKTAAPAAQTPDANPEAAPNEGATPMLAPDQRAKIEMLDADIGRQRLELGAREGAGADQVCEGLSECTDACNLADSICANADKICEIAEDVRDPWALERCDSAKTSCTEARAICDCCKQK